MTTNIIPWEDIDLSDFLPECNALVEWESLEEVESSNGKYMFKAVFEVLEPEEYAGRKHFENYVVGPDFETKEFDLASFGLKNLARARIAANIRAAGDPEEFCSQVEAEKPRLVLHLKPPEKGANFQNNTITSYHSLNAVKVGVLQGKPKATAPKNLPKAPAKKAPKAQTKPAPKEPIEAPVVIEEPATVQTVAAVKPAEKAPAKDDTLMINCPKCNQKVHAMEFGAHHLTCQG